jgi:multimeric flavodoxin WrbA
MTEAEIFILGTPNYFDNVSGLMKDFIDRTNPFYETDKLKGKKLITIVVGGGKVENSEKVGNRALKCFSYAHKLNYIGAYCFKGLNDNDIENDPKSIGAIDKIIKSLK